MPNPAMPDHTGLCFRPADGFHQDDDRRDHSGVCFHPGDDRRDQSGVHFRPADDNTSTKSFNASSSDVSHPCFRPADDEPVAIGTGRPVSPCHHPSEPGDHTGRTENLAAGLHRTLTEFEQQHLAALSSRS